IGVRFYLTATGAGASAQTTFTDGHPQDVTLTPGTRTVSPGESAEYLTSVNMVGNSSPCTVTLEVEFENPPAGVTATFNDNPVSLPDEQGNSDFVRTLTIATAPDSLPGTYSFIVQALRGTGCTGNGPSPAVEGTLVIEAGDNEAPTSTIVLNPASPD